MISDFAVEFATFGFVVLHGFTSSKAGFEELLLQQFTLLQQASACNRAAWKQEMFWYRLADGGSLQSSLIPDRLGFVLVVSNSRICGSDMWGTDPKTCTADGGRTTQKRALVLWVFPTEWRIHKGFDDSSSFYVIWVSANQPINQKVFQEVAFLNSEDRGHLIVWRWIALKPSTVYPFLNLHPHCNEHSLRRLQTLNNGWNNFGFLPVSIPILRLLLAVPVNVHLQHRRCIALYKCMWLTWIRLLLSCQT